MNVEFRKILQWIVILALCLSLALSYTQTAQAATCTWTGSVSRAWSTAGNWSCGHVPVYPDDVVIADVANDPLITDVTVESHINNFTVQTGAVLELTSGGRLNMSADGTTVTNNGTIKITGTLEGSWFDIYTPGQFTNAGVIDINAGTFNIYSSGGGTQTGSFSGRYGSINLHGNNVALFTFNVGSLINVKSIFFDNTPETIIYGTVNQTWPESIFSLYNSDVYVMLSTPYQLGALSLSAGSVFGTFLSGSLSSSLAVQAGETLIGSGTITGNLENAGTVSPGSSPGVISVGGNFSQASTGKLAIELGGTTAGSGYDQLAVTGSATLAGTLDVSLIAPFNPALGQSFTVLTYASPGGSFETINLPALDAGLAWQTTYGGTALTLEVVKSGGSISGTVTCLGSISAATQTVFANLWTDITTPPPIDAKYIHCGESYTFTDLADGTYYVDAWLDLDNSGSGPPGPGEPDAWYGAPDAIVISGGNAVTGKDITLRAYYVFLPLARR